jgi:2-C-methyl-D-erythritol 4-phosphate cytidylyltransferase
MAVGTNIKRRRLELGISQQELANLVGYKTRSSIAKIESEKADITVQKIVKFAQALDIAPEILFSGFYSEANVKATKSGKTELSKEHKVIAIILAGGDSKRNQRIIPNQFVEILGKPVIIYCLEAYQNHPFVDEIYIVCLKGWEQIVIDYSERFGITKVKGVLTGGESGLISVKNAVDYLKARSKEDDLIILQESTRPLVTTEMISKVISVGTEKGACVLCHKMQDNIQFFLENNKPKYIDRNAVVDIQSPEAYRYSIIENVLFRAEKMGIALNDSCCAMLLYKLGYGINFIENSSVNLKIIRNEDILYFKSLIKHE